MGVAVGVVACSRWEYAGAFALAMCAAPVLWYAFAAEQGWIRVFFAAALLLPPLPVPWGDSGPHPAAVVAVAGVLAALVRAGTWRIHATVLNLSILWLFAALLASVGFAAAYSGPVIAANSAVRVMLFGISVLVYFTAVQEGGADPRQRTLRLLFWLAVAAAGFGCIDFWFQLPAPAGYGPQYIWLDSGVYRRAQGLFYESSTLGTFCSLFLVMAAVALLERRERRAIKRVWLWAGAVVFGLALLLSYSRGALASAGIGIGTLAVLERKRWLRTRPVLVAMALMGAVAAVFLLAFPEVAFSYWARLGFTFENALSRPDRVLSGRLDNWRVLVDFVTSHPWQTVAGVGYKTLAYTQQAGRPVIADNMYLSALVETGIAGLAGLIALNAAIFRAAWRGLRSENSFYAKWMFCFQAGFAVQMLSGDLLTYWRVLPVFFWVLAQATKEQNHANPAD